MKKILAKYILETLSNKYNNSALTTESIIQKIEMVLTRNGDVAQAILDTHVINFGDNVQNLEEFNALVETLKNEEVNL